MVDVTGLSHTKLVIDVGTSEHSGEAVGSDWFTYERHQHTLC